ncbi:ABC transporter ATP-binding protein [Methylobacterium tarhaniae]|uniref:ABC transporter ATP-binding protein n=1 Tax=Methylobacterium tarhaniae TaxID=1187852 RepID=A0A0J6SJI6_9HYPH|nr:multiple monosaccharide ABC transporter ATP-binding protein [Methylobacterium tarhaniae]KMO33799.1 ABC transporter ATP-binding protein [Methylobacterium tarhaniae]
MAASPALAVVPKTSPILEMRGITKAFPGVKALDNVNLAVRAGEIHAVCGENGAGKSTLMKVLSGVYPAGSYDGHILFDGEERRFSGIPDSEALGIIIIHQELALVPLLSIAENIFLGNEAASRFGVIDWPVAMARTRDLLARVGLNEAPETLVTDLGVGKQQLVEIAKALSKRVRLLILDEPTASLNESDSAALLTLLEAFREQGITSILISHKLNEIARVADSVTILRDGASVETLPREAMLGPDGKLNEDRIIKGMVGRDLAHRYPPREGAAIGEPLLEVKNWSVRHPLHPDRLAVEDVSLTVRRGEVVGMAGLLGAGRTEFAMSLFGGAYGQRVAGEARLRGEPADLGSVEKAIRAGLAYATEDRKGYGLVLHEDIRTNVSLANLAGVAARGVIDEDRERAVAERYRERLRIRSSGIDQATVNLSGGNQQKVVLSKWLFADPDVLILDEPTRGIDVGAKYEIYAIINDLARQGKGVLIISSEMPELLGMCDRILVMNRGRIVGELPAAQASQEAIMRAIVTSGG